MKVGPVVVMIRGNIGYVYIIATTSGMVSIAVRLSLSS